jgi:uncharacterized Zn finger protein
MELPRGLNIECPNCGEETLHRVIKGRIGERKMLTLTALVRCSRCGLRHNTVIREEKPVCLPVIVSNQDNSSKHEMELAGDEEIYIGSEYQINSGRIIITAIDTGKGRVEVSRAKNVTTLWAKTFDRIKLPISVNRGDRTLNRIIWAVPDEEFFIGDVMRIKGLSVTIHRIKTKNRILKKGNAVARDIVRLYAKIVR